MILSHPNNRVKKWKLQSLNKNELIEMWNNLCNDDDPDDSDDHLYPEYNIQGDSDDDDDVEEVDDVYNNLTNNNNDNDVNGISKTQLNQGVNNLRSRFQEVASDDNTDIDVLIDDVNEKLNDLLDECNELSKEEENNILNNFENMINKYTN
jgi:hypothetical protein